MRRSADFSVLDGLAVSPSYTSNMQLSSPCATHDRFECQIPDVYFRHRFRCSPRSWRTPAFRRFCRKTRLLARNCLITRIPSRQSDHFETTFGKRCKLRATFQFSETISCSRVFQQYPPASGNLAAKSQSARMAALSRGLRLPCRGAIRQLPAPLRRPGRRGRSRPIADCRIYLKPFGKVVEAATGIDCQFRQNGSLTRDELASK